jgi:hypothetical protein
MTITICEGKGRRESQARGSGDWATGRLGDGHAGRARAARDEIAELLQVRRIPRAPDAAREELDQLREVDAGPVAGTSFVARASPKAGMLLYTHS